MRHWTPRIADAVERALAAARDASSASCWRRTTRGCRSGGTASSSRRPSAGAPSSASSSAGARRAGFVELLAERVRDAGAHVVFTAHSLPARILDEGDPYRDELLETARLVAEHAGVGDWSFSFQSESPTGEPWLQPDILDHLDALRARGISTSSPARSASSPTTSRSAGTSTWRRASAHASSGSGSRRIEMPNAEPAFVAVLAGLVRRALPVPSTG